MSILVTRPDERGTQLVNWLNQAGLSAVHLPLFRLEMGSEYALVAEKMQQLNCGDYVFAVSKSAVDFAVKSLADTASSWRNDLHYVTVGHRTAQYFSCQTAQEIHYPILAESSEGVLALPIMQQLQGKKLLILRGNGGRELLAEQAILRGARVEMLECYQRAPIPDNQAIQTQLGKQSGVKTIVATSLDILKRLLELVPPTEQTWLKNCTLVTVSQRIADFAMQANWHQVVIAPKADNPSLLHTLLEIK